MLCLVGEHEARLNRINIIRHVSNSASSHGHQEIISMYAANVPVEASRWPAT